MPRLSSAGGQQSLKPVSAREGRRARSRLRKGREGCDRPRSFTSRQCWGQVKTHPYIEGEGAPRDIFLFARYMTRVPTSTVLCVWQHRCRTVCIPLIASGRLNLPAYFRHHRGCVPTPGGASEGAAQYCPEFLFRTGMHL